MTRFADMLPSETESSDETAALGERLADRLQRGDIIALYGDLGAGKTVLAKGICVGLGLEPSQVNSPTYTVLNEYRTGPTPVFHFDAYRIKALAEFYDLGYEEYFFSDGISIVEWAEKVEPLLPEETIRVRLEHGDGDRRRVRIVENGTEL